MIEISNQSQALGTLTNIVSKMVKECLNKEATFDTLKTGRVIEAESEQAYRVFLEGDEYIIPSFGTSEYKKDDIVKVFVPNGDLNSMFILTNSDVVSRKVSSLTDTVQATIQEVEEAKSDLAGVSTNVQVLDEVLDEVTGDVYNLSNEYHGFVGENGDYQVFKQNTIGLIGETVEEPGGVYKEMVSSVDQKADSIIMQVQTEWKYKLDENGNMVYGVTGLPVILDENNYEVYQDSLNPMLFYFKKDDTYFTRNGNTYTPLAETPITVIPVENVSIAGKMAQIKLTSENLGVRISDLNDKVFAMDVTINGINLSFLGSAEKYISFVDGSIILGNNEDNAVTLMIENDQISFWQDNSKVAYISNNQLKITDVDVENKLDLGNFSFVPRLNGNMSLIKTKEE